MTFRNSLWNEQMHYHCRKLHKSVHVNFNRHNLGRILNYKSLHNAHFWCLGLSSFVRIPRRGWSRRLFYSFTFYLISWILMKMHLSYYICRLLLINYFKIEPTKLSFYIASLNSMDSMFASIFHFPSLLIYAFSTFKTYCFLQEISCLFCLVSNYFLPLLRCKIKSRNR